MSKLIDKVLEIFLMILLISMVILAIWQVSSRYLLNSPSSFSEELLTYMLVWLTMIGGAYTYGKGRHIAITYLFKKFDKENQLFLNIIVNGLIIFFAILVLIYGGGTITLASVGRMTASLGVSYAYVYISAFIAGLMFVAYGINFIIPDFKELRKIEKGGKK